MRSRLGTGIIVVMAFLGLALAGVARGDGRSATPSPYDTGWFDDADKLPIPSNDTRKSTDCLTDVRMDTGSGSVAHVPQRDQAGGTCGACVAADLYDAWGKTHDPPSGFKNRAHCSSDLVLAVEFAGDYRDGHVGGRRVADILKKVPSLGTCDQSNVSNLAPDAFREDAKHVYDGLWAQWEDVQKGAKTVESAAHDISCKLIPRILSRSAARSFQDTVGALRLGTANEYFAQIFANACQGAPRERLALPTPTTEAPFPALNRIFNSGAAPLQPIALTFCSNVLYKGDSFDPNTDRCPNNAPYHVDHVSSIVGRRWNSLYNRCEFLVKNSWGTSCNHYTNSGLDCENGKVWLSADLVAKSAVSITHLNK